MLEKCRRDQWRIDDLDWTQKPRELSRDDEEAIVQYFTDMAGIERLAGALFEEQRRRATDPRLAKIFSTFVVDEERHAKAAERLAAFYDVHRYKTYRMNENLARFTPHFLAAVRHLSDEIANAYVTGGELILDVALLRSLNDYVHDPMSEQAMELINRDESRHIAIDFYMTSLYASDAYVEAAAHRPPEPLKKRLYAAWTIANVIYYAAPFFRDVFFQPMERVDPTGRRMREAFKRIQLISAKPGVARRPFGKFMQGLSDLFNHPIAGRLFGNVLARLAGVDARFMKRMYTEEEFARASTLSWDALADEALAAKYALPRPALTRAAGPACALSWRATPKQRSGRRRGPPGARFGRGPPPSAVLEARAARRTRAASCRA